jgi:hypothetical protein
VGRHDDLGRQLLPQAGLRRAEVGRRGPWKDPPGHARQKGRVQIRRQGLDLASGVASQVLSKRGEALGAMRDQQFSELLELEPKSDRIQKALTYARRNL